MRAVADLELPLHRLDQRRHHVAELFAAPAPAAPSEEAVRVDR